MQVIALIADTPETFAAATVRLCLDQDLHARVSRNGLEHARARLESREASRRLLETMARLPALTPKRLGAIDQARIRSRATYEASGVDASVGRLSSLLSLVLLSPGPHSVTWTLAGDMNRRHSSRPAINPPAPP